MPEKRSANVTAWVLDDTIAVAAEGAALAGVPGIWHPDRPVAPQAFGMSVGEFAQVVTDLDLPLRRVTVKPSDAILSFDGHRRNHLESADAAFGTPVSPASAEALAAGGGALIEATREESERIERTTQDEAARGVVVLPEEDS